MYVIPSTEVRQVKHLGVFFVTATWSVLAYVWLYLIIAQISPGEVQVGTCSMCAQANVAGVAVVPDINHHDAKQLRDSG